MDLSIIVPCHNLENYIQPLLESLSKQWLNTNTAEVIFVLDDCTDRTKDIIEEWINHGQKITASIIEVNVHSCGIARNAGLLKAQGNYVWFVDGDDWIASPDAINIILDYAYFTGANYIQFEYGHPKTFHYHGHPAMVWQYVFERGTLSNIRFTDIQPHEDLYFMQAYQAQYGKPAFLRDELYYYNYLREGSNVQQFLEKGRIDP